MNISIRHIEHFIVVAQELHFRRAAELANVAQPALSRSVQTLESELGIKLLERNNRNVQLTPAGKEFLNGCTDMMEAMESTIGKSIRARQHEYGGLNIGYTYVAMCGRLPKLLKEFEAIHQNIIVEPIGLPSPEQLEKLNRRELDVCFVTGPISVQGFNTEVFQTDKFVVITSKDHHFSNRSSVSLDELSREKILLRVEEKACAFNQHVCDFFREAGLQPKIEYMDYDHIGLLGRAVLGKGVCIATEGYGCIYDSNLHICKISGLNNTLPTLLTWRKDTDSESVAAFRQFIQRKSHHQHIEKKQPSPDVINPLATTE